MLISKSIFNDKYFKRYNNIFHYKYTKFNLINNYILYNLVLKNYSINNICNFKLIYDYYKQTYNNIILKKNNEQYPGLNFDYIIINKIINNNNINKKLIICNNRTILFTNENIDILLYFDINYSEEQRITYTNYAKNKYKNNKIYSSLVKSIYLQFLNNLKTNNEQNNVSIPKTKYELISCHLGYKFTLSLTASYKIMLEIPNILSTISMSLKLLEKDGILLLFWTILNINIPIIKKLVSLLSYGFKNIEIIDNDINQNLLIGVPEYYIKCSGYKDNISDELINKLLDIAIETIEYTYDKCDILDYYEEYTKNNPNHSLFYNKKEKERTHRDRSHKYKQTKKFSFSSNSSSRFSSSSRFKSSSRHKSSSLSTRKSSQRRSTKKNKHITPIYYIEDMNIPELDNIMKDSNLQFKVSLLMNKLEGIFIGYFEMVNNLMVNSIGTDKFGNMYVKSSAILQKDITNLTKLITMFEYNKLPYNKHALSTLLKKKNEVVEHFYSLDKPINHKFIKYNDRTSKSLNKHALDRSHQRSLKSSKDKEQDKYQDKYQDKDQYDTNILSDYYQKINIALQVKNKLLEDIGLESAPKKVLYNTYDFSSGLSDFINNKYNHLPIKINMEFIKLWEILTTFRLIPESSTAFNVLQLSEPSKQTIMATEYWVKKKCPNLKPKMYMSYNDTIKNNNIKSIVKQYNDTKLDLIISNAHTDTDMYTNVDNLKTQKMSIAQVISILGLSNIKGSCCVKHTIPYRHIDSRDGNITHIDSIDSINNIESNMMFISYLYLYYISFNTMSLYKPNTSAADNGEFYVVCKGFLGINEDKLNHLYHFFNHFKLNNTIIHPEYIPKSFIIQVHNFLNDMSNLNVISIEKQNLLLTCFNSLSDKIENNKNINKILNCKQFLDKKSVDTMLIPKYKEWINIFNFE